MVRAKNDAAGAVVALLDADPEDAKIRRKTIQYELHAVEPPLLAEFLVGLLTKKRYRDGLLKCLDEGFDNDLTAGMSLRRARWRYWAAALHSIGPQLWAAAKRIGCIGLVPDYIRGKLG